jgi:hypothetical protein
MIHDEIPIPCTLGTFFTVEDRVKRISRDLLCAADFLLTV